MSEKVRADRPRGHGSRCWVPSAAFGDLDRPRPRRPDRRLRPRRRMALGMSGLIVPRLRGGNHRARPFAQDRKTSRASSAFLPASGGGLGRGLRSRRRRNRLRGAMAPPGSRFTAIRCGCCSRILSGEPPLLCWSPPPAGWCRRPVVATVDPGAPPMSRHRRQKNLSLDPATTGSAALSVGAGPVRIPAARDDPVRRRPPTAPHHAGLTPAPAFSAVASWCSGGARAKLYPRLLHESGRFPRGMLSGATRCMWTVISPRSYDRPVSTAPRLARR